MEDVKMEDVKNEIINLKREFSAKLLEVTNEIQKNQELALDQSRKCFIETYVRKFKIKKNKIKGHVHMSLI